MTSGDDLFSYIAEEIAPDEKDQLYNDVFTCLSVFRSLAPLAQQLVLRMLLPDCPASAALAVHQSPLNCGPADVPQWRKFWTEHKDKLDPLEKLRVCITQDTDLRLNPPFRKSLIQGLAGVGRGM